MSHNHRNPPVSRSRHHIGNSSLPPLPPMHVSSRSHSLDGLLDSQEAKNWSTPKEMDSSACLTVEGLNYRNDTSDTMDSVNRSDKGMNKEAVRNTTSRRSKSLDDLLDEDGELLMVETQSLENILENAGSKIDSNESVVFSVSPISSEKMCENEVIMIDSSMLVPSEPYIDNDNSQNDSGIQCDASNFGIISSDNNSLDDDTISNTISITSSTSESKPNKTFLNKYIKKVKNLIKK